MQHLLCSGSKYCNWKEARGRSSPRSSSALLAAHSPARAAPFRLTQAGLGRTAASEEGGRTRRGRALACVESDGEERQRIATGEDEVGGADVL
jgi:hypothetical protein